ncbi:MAG TPA: S46 family peptidase, partial [Acidobacteriota bacterium]|nr:S46 family peptidase [Acidobacteriota bacterium]
MRLKLLASVLLTIVLLGQALPLRADEGMWLPDTIGNRQLLQKMKAKGFALRPEDIFSNTAPSLKDAIVIVDGGTAEFVSDRGLLLTNHHVAFQAIATESTPEKDYLKNGFVSKSETEEIAIKDETYHCKILKESRDVTTEVLAGVTDQMNAEERNTAIETKR